MLTTAVRVAQKHRVFARSIPAAILAMVLGWGTPAVSGDDDLRYSSAGDGASLLFQFPPDTPAQLIEAARIAIRLDRPADSRGFLRQLLERDPQAPEMLALRRRYGLYTLIEFRLDPRLQPEAGQLLKHMQSALPKLSASELSERASRLGTGLSAAADAEFELLAAGDAALPALLSLDPATQAGRAASQMLEVFAADWRRGLLALLPTLDVPSRVRVLGILAGSDKPDLFEPLLRLQFTATETAETQAAAAAVQRLARGRKIPETNAAAAAMFVSLAEESLAVSGGQQRNADSVDAGAGTSVGQSSALARAAALLESAAAIEPENVQVKLLQQVAAAAVADPSLATPAGPSAGRPLRELLSVLKIALAIPQPNAVIDILKAINAVGIVEVTSDSLDVLKATLDSPDARIRALGAELILRSNLSASPLRSRARQQITAMLGGAARPEAVVIMADGQQRLLFRHLLEDRGFAATSAATGPEGFSAAADCLHCEVVVLSLRTSRWPAAMTLANLRADRRTQMATVILLGDGSARTRAEALAEIHGNVVFLEEPVGAITFDSRLSKLRLPPVLLPATDRALLQQRVAGLLADER
jgi:CheY-like chemotaxis protein